MRLLHILAVSLALLLAGCLNLVDHMRSADSLYEAAEQCQDPKRAAHLYLLAAERHHKRACRCIAECFENGKGVAQDFVKAEWWYYQAIDGSKDRDYLNRKQEEMKRREFERKKALLSQRVRARRAGRTQSYSCLQKYPLDQVKLALQYKRNPSVEVLAQITNKEILEMMIDPEHEVNVRIRDVSGWGKHWSDLIGRYCYGEYSVNTWYKCVERSVNHEREERRAEYKQEALKIEADLANEIGLLEERKGQYLYVENAGAREKIYPRVPVSALEKVLCDSLKNLTLMDENKSQYQLMKSIASSCSSSPEVLAMLVRTGWRVKWLGTSLVASIDEYIDEKVLRILVLEGVDVPQHYAKRVSSTEVMEEILVKAHGTGGGFLMQVARNLPSEKLGIYEKVSCVPLRAILQDRIRGISSNKRIMGNLEDSMKPVKGEFYQTKGGTKVLSVRQGYLVARVPVEMVRYEAVVDGGTKKCPWNSLHTRSREHVEHYEIIVHPMRTYQPGDYLAAGWYECIKVEDGGLPEFREAEPSRK